MARKLLIVLIMLLLLAPLKTVQATETLPMVYVVELTGTVDPGLYRFLQRAFQEAKEAGSSAIILEIDTPGGIVETAMQIKKLIYSSSVPVYAYVRHSALSAGAYIALSCRKLYMAPGSTIGAAEIKSFTGERVDEKTFSAWEAEMRTVAQNQGKDPQLAAAMVRREIAIEGLVNDRQLLTLTTQEAEELNFTDGVFVSREELLAKLNLQDAELTEITPSPAERLARLITNPVVATLLLVIGLAAMVIEVITAGFGAAGIISIIAFTLYFGGHIIAGLAGNEVIILFILGIILLLIEVVVPGFGIIGIAGIISLCASIILSAATTAEGLIMLVTALLLAAAVVAVLFRCLKRSPIWSKIVLQHAETKEQGYVGASDYSHLVGQVGEALTPLRPAGTVEIDGQRFDVVSEGGFIAPGTTVNVVKVEGARIVVRKN